VNERIVSRLCWGILAVAGVLGGVLGGLFGLPFFLLVLAGGALSLVILLMWASLQQMENDESMGFEQALSYAAPSAEEEQKRALLRTLKDLEYELSVGKISREDYDLVSKEVRERAKRVIALSDDAMKERIAQAEARLVAYARQQAETKKERASSKKKSVSKNPSAEEKS
jgi:hypothetical protein